MPLGVGILDLDHFKKINDNYGHLAGDKVLASCTKIIKNLLRDGDIVLRYGGEEFLIVLPGASMKDTAFIAEKIRRVIEDNQIYYGEFKISVTCSMGITSIPEGNFLSAEELLKKIDEALYFSKSNVRNTVTHAAVHR